MNIRFSARALVFSMFISFFISTPVAQAAVNNSYLSRTYAAFGSEIVLYGTDLNSADRITITDTSSPPSFRYHSTTFTHVSDTEIRITLPLSTEPTRSFTPDTWYNINVNSSTSIDSNYLGIYLYEPQPFDGLNGKVECSADGFVSISSQVLVSRTSCTGALTLPTGVTEIGNDAFSYDSNLTQINFPSSLLHIGTQAFIGATRITSMTLPSNLESIGSAAFAGTNITSVNIPNRVTSIGTSAFENSTALTNVTFGTGLIEIGEKAFKNTALTNVIIPASVTTIGNQAFRDISTLQSIEYCWPDGLYATNVLNGFEYVNLICDQRTSINVTSTTFSGAGSLKEAIEQINASPEEESFIVNLPAGIYSFSAGLPVILRDLEIRGVGTSTVMNLVGFGSDPSDNQLFSTSRTSVDLILKNLTFTGAITSGSLIRNQKGNVLIRNSTFRDIDNVGGNGLIESYGELNDRTFAVTECRDVEFQNVSGGTIFFSDHGYAPSTSTNDSDYNNRIYIKNSVFDDVTNIAQVERFLKIENSFFKNSPTSLIATGNNRFQLLNSTFENILSMNLNTAWNPITDYSTRSGVQTSLTSNEKVISGNQFKLVAELSPFINLNTSSWNVGLLTFSNNNFEFTSNTSQKTPELSDVLNNAASFTSETVFSGNRYFYPSTITFNGNSATSGSMTAIRGVGISSLPPNQFIRNGFSFYGWNTQADGLGTSFTNQAAYTYGVDQTLFAIWTKNPIASDSNTQADTRLLENKAKQARELQQLLTVLPSIGKLALEIGKLIENLTTQKCAKGKKIKKIKAGAKCPKGYKLRK